MIAEDQCDGTVLVISGGTGVNPSIPGTYFITYNAFDSSDNAAVEVTRTVEVVDSIAPSITCPNDIVIECTNPNGETVVFSVPTAMDICDPSPTIVCTPPSGSLFVLGTTNVTCTATDSSGNESTCTFNITVQDTAPPEIVCPETAVVACGESIDPSNAGFAAASDVCDDHVTLSFEDESDSPPESCAGIIQRTWTATDDSGNSSMCIQTIIVFDPDGGFVTGGGTFPLLPGAFAADFSVSGTGNFGFVAKYKKGDDVPTGNTEFQLQAADLNFHAVGYDWLVVVGHKAVYQGFGTINGDGNFGVLVSVIDEKLTDETDVDKFRIKIWDTDAGDLVIYDTQAGDPDDVAPTTVISTGSVVIHKASGGGKAKAGTDVVLRRLTTAIAVDEKGELWISFTGDPYAAYVIDSSEDAENWRQLSYFVTDVDGRYEYLVGKEYKSGERKFYRIVPMNSGSNVRNSSKVR